MRKPLEMVLFILIMFSSLVSHGYNRGEMRDLELKQEHKFLDTNDLQKENQEKVEKINKKTPGFVKLNDEDSRRFKFDRDDILLVYIITGVLNQVFRKETANYYKLTIKVSCIMNGLPLLMIPKFSSLNWSLDIGSNKPIKGTIQTDDKGIGSIFLSSKEEMINHSMTFERKDQSTMIKLLDGPYDIVMPTEACKK